MEDISGGKELCCGKTALRQGKLASCIYMVGWRLLVLVENVQVLWRTLVLMENVDGLFRTLVLEKVCDAGELLYFIERIGVNIKW